MFRRRLLPLLLLTCLPASGYGQSYNPLRDAGTGLADLLDTDTLAILGGGAVLTLAALPFDQRVRNATEGNYNQHDLVLDVGDFWQHGFMALGGIELAVGLAAGKPRLVDASLALLEAAGVQALLEVALKYSFNRQTPCQCELPATFPPVDKSFPSGQSSWVLVGNSLMFFGPEVWIPATALALAGSWERVYRRKHWVSDIPLGVAISLALGISFSKHHLKPDQPEAAARGKAGSLDLHVAMPGSNAAGVLLEYHL